MSGTEMPPPRRVAQLAGWIAFAGGLAMLAIATLTVVSVLRRWLTSQPVPGDFELISIGSGIAVFGCLAYGTLMRTNILVDTFTSWLPRRLQQGIDAFWHLVWAACAAVLAERLALGARETLASGTTTMVLGMPTWWAIGLGAGCFAVTAAVALAWGLQLLRGRG